MIEEGHVGTSEAEKQAALAAASASGIEDDVEEGGSGTESPKPAAQLTPRQERDEARRIIAMTMRQIKVNSFYLNCTPILLSVA